MSYIVANNGYRMVVLTAMLLTSQVCPAAPNNILAPVAAMYRNFAWEALTNDSELFGSGLVNQPATVLSRYFDPQLSKMIADDAACQRRTESFCKIDFDILFDSQEPRIVDLTIASGAPGTVDVRFKDPVTDKQTLITYTVARQTAGWRISDVTYTRDGRRPLRALLAVPLSRGNSQHRK